MKMESVEVQYANSQKNNPYFNTYNLSWKDHSNFKWSNNMTLNANQGCQHVPQAPQSKPSFLEETLTNFMKTTQSSFDRISETHEDMFKTDKEMAQNQSNMNKNTKASINNLEIQIGPLSQQLAAKASLSERKSETCKVLELRNKVIPSKIKISDGKKT